MRFTATLTREETENDDVISLLKETITSRGMYESKFLLLWRENEANCGKRSKLSPKKLWSEPEKIFPADIFIQHYTNYGLDTHPPSSTFVH